MSYHYAERHSIGTKNKRFLNREIFSRDCRGKGGDFYSHG